MRVVQCINAYALEGDLAPVVIELQGYFQWLTAHLTVGGYIDNRFMAVVIVFPVAPKFTTFY